MNNNQSNDHSHALLAQVEEAAVNKTRLNIAGNGSKSFLGVINEAAAIDVHQHVGIISYEPTELVITARAGTTLNTIKSALAEYDQTLAFEPPGFGHNATLGGTVACALAGPAKPYLGGVRDYILGCKVLTGHGQVLQFGGEVMKNVAGYDVSRLMTGAMGTLGVLLELSIKVLPAAQQEVTLAHQTDINAAIEKMQALAGTGLPVTASAFLDGTQYTRLSGTEATISAAANQLDGDRIDNTDLWQHLREHQLDFYHTPDPQAPESLWRISVPALTPPLDIQGEWIYDWAGTQRWLTTDTSPQEVRASATAAGGHATLYRADAQLKQTAGVFHPLDTPLLKLHQRIKHEFDPHGIFNHQRLFPEF